MQGMVPRFTSPGQKSACYNPNMYCALPSPARSFSRLAGAALGTMCGDALGMPVEGWSAARIARVHGRLDRMLPGRLAAGSYTDDSQMMIAILETLAQRGGLDPAYLARRFLARYEPIRGYGGRINALMHRLAAGEPWDRVATDSWGNGGAMRVGVLGVFFAKDRESCRAAALTQCRITHTHSRALAGAAARSWPCAGPPGWGQGPRAGPRAVRGAYRRPGREPGRPCGRTPAGHASPAPGRRGRGPRGPHPRLCLRRVRRRGGAPGPGGLFGGPGPGAGNGSGGQPGGDADTIGAMAGAMAGAYWGLEALPAQWLEALENQPLGRDAVLELCRNICDENY